MYGCGSEAMLAPPVVDVIEAAQCRRATIMNTAVN